jgi:hypothetical protein
MKELKFPIRSATPEVHCKIFEDNSGALEMASLHKFRPRTKHLHVKLHFFRDYNIIRKEITVNGNCWEIDIHILWRALPYKFLVLILPSTQLVLSPEPPTNVRSFGTTDYNK